MRRCRTCSQQFKVSTSNKWKMQCGRCGNKDQMKRNRLANERRLAQPKEPEPDNEPYFAMLRAQTDAVRPYRPENSDSVPENPPVVGSGHG